MKGMKGGRTTGQLGRPFTRTNTCDISSPSLFFFFFFFFFFSPGCCCMTILLEEAKEAKGIKLPVPTRSLHDTPPSFIITKYNNNIVYRVPSLTRSWSHAVPLCATLPPSSNSFPFIIFFSIRLDSTRLDSTRCCCCEMLCVCCISFTLLALDSIHSSTTPPPPRPRPRWIQFNRFSTTMWRGIHPSSYPISTPFFPPPPPPPAVCVFLLFCRQLQCVIRRVCGLWMQFIHSRRKEEKKRSQKSVPSFLPFYPRALLQPIDLVRPPENLEFTSTHSSI